MHNDSAALAPDEREAGLRAALRKALPAAVNFRFLPPRPVEDGIWDEVAGELAAALAAAQAPAREERLDVAELSRAFTLHRISLRADPDDYLGHDCAGDCAEAIADEYHALWDDVRPRHPQSWRCSRS